MTEQEIMQLVEEAGMFALIGPISHLLHHEIVCLQRFANLVAKREREACAKVCEDTTQEYEPYTGSPYRLNYTYAAAVRARGEKENNHG